MRVRTFVGCVVAFLGVGGGVVTAEPITTLAYTANTSSSSGGGTVGYRADVRYTATSATQGSLQIKMTNTLGVGNITAFVFNIAGNNSWEVLTPNPTDLISGGNGFWNLTTQDGLTVLTDTEKAPPYGRYEAGIAIGGIPDSGSLSFTGSGSGHDVEGIGYLGDNTYGYESGTFNFTINGSGAGALSAASFLSDFNGGLATSTFAVRFKGIGGNDNSDKVLGGGSVIVIPPPGVGVGGATPVPLPAAVWGGLVLMGGLGLRRKLKSR